MGLREVKVDEKLRAKSYGAGLPATVRVYESHQDQVRASFLIPLFIPRFRYLGGLQSRFEFSLALSTSQKHIARHWIELVG